MLDDNEELFMCVWKPKQPLCPVLQPSVLELALEERKVRILRKLFTVFDDDLDLEP